MPARLQDVVPSATWPRSATLMVAGLSELAESVARLTEPRIVIADLGGDARSYPPMVAGGLAEELLRWICK